MYYKPYDSFFLSKQTWRLHLWDELGIPHKKEKQEFGSVLCIISFKVNPNTMMVIMDYSSRKELLSLIRDFAITWKKHILKKFQCIVGHINWVLNVFPLLHPGLSALYAKTAGKESDFANIRVNAAVDRKLTWIASRVESSTGVHFLKSIEWDPRSTDLNAFTFFMDASSLGIAFFLPCAKLAYQCPSPSPELSQHIFFHEALAVCSVFHHFVAAYFQSVTHRLVIYTDCSNTFDIFSSLRAIAPYNQLLISAMNVILDHEIDFHILHVQGINNPITDALLCFKNDLAISLCPGLIIQTFEPPQDVLGVASKNGYRHIDTPLLHLCA